MLHSISLPTFWRATYELKPCFLFPTCSNVTPCAHRPYRTGNSTPAAKRFCRRYLHVGRRTVMSRSGYKILSIHPVQPGGPTVCPHRRNVGKIESQLIVFQPITSYEGYHPRVQWGHVFGTIDKNERRLVGLKY